MFFSIYALNIVVPDTQKSALHPWIPLNLGYQMVASKVVIKYFGTKENSEKPIFCTENGILL